MYDFQIFGYYAAAIASTFFPSGNEFASLMLSLATFGTGFLIRPLGALVLGPYVDHRGRREGLLLTLGLMAAGTVSIACTPSYASIGLIASVRNRDARRQRFLHELAVVQPTVGGDLLCGARSGAYIVAQG